jgi:hypothetical protein
VIRPRPHPDPTCIAFLLHWNHHRKAVHWHWPRWDIVNCAAVAELLEDDEDPSEQEDWQ